MPYYLRHFFQPDLLPGGLPHPEAGSACTLALTSAAPLEYPAGKTPMRASVWRCGRRDARERGYVHNVKPGQILAELVPLENKANPDPRFIFANARLPAGDNTAPSAASPLCLEACAAGYACYKNGLITVQTALTVNSDVNFHTGNINFCGDLNILRDIGGGFHVKGENVRVEGGVSCARVTARRNLTVSGGARGNFHGGTRLHAGRDMKLTFADKVELHARKNIDVVQCLHSTLQVGGSLLVRGNLNGGVCRVHGPVIVLGDVGNPSFTPTTLRLGDDPFTECPLQRCRDLLDKAHKQTERCAPLAAHLPPDANDAARRLYRMRRAEAALRKQLDFLLNLRQQSLAENQVCSTVSGLYATGTIYPGVIIQIGERRFAVETPYRHMRFHSEGDAIVATPMPGEV